MGHRERVEWKRVKENAIPPIAKRVSKLPSYRKRLRQAEIVLPEIKFNTQRIPILRP